MCVQHIIYRPTLNTNTIFYSIAAGVEWDNDLLKTLRGCRMAFFEKHQFEGPWVEMFRVSTGECVAGYPSLLEAASCMKKREL